MKILMTGGTGLIGRRFIVNYSQHDYVVLTRSITKARAMLPKTVELIQDLSEITDFYTFDAVINLAGEPIIDKRWTENQKEVICQSRWQVTQQLVDLIVNCKNPPEVFLSGSAIGIYPIRGDSEITESADLDDESFSTKLCQHWELIAQKAEPFTRVVFLRTGIVLDTEGGALAKLLLPFKLYLGGNVGDGKHYMSWIHAMDMVRAVEFLLNEKNISGAVNLVSPEPVRNEEFTKVLADALNRVAFMVMPKVIMKFLLGESSSLLLDSQKVKPTKLTENNFQFLFPNLKSAFDNLLNNKVEK